MNAKGINLRQTRSVWDLWACFGAATGRRRDPEPADVKLSVPLALKWLLPLRSSSPLSPVSLPVFRSCFCGHYLLFRGNVPPNKINGLERRAGADPEFPCQLYFNPARITMATNAALPPQTRGCSDLGSFKLEASPQLRM